MYFKYDIQGERPRLKSAEALIRWKHPQMGMISPGVFIPLFESNGLIRALDYHAWKEAGNQLSEWQKKYGWSPDISVNVSRVDLYDTKLLEKLDSIILESGIRKEQMPLEITESAYAEDPKRIVAVVDSLRKNGYRIEMDDFGSGYSSLNMLSSMSIDVLKLDMKFIQNARAEARNYRLIELMIDIAKYLDVSMTAEGVETEEEYRLLKESGCDLIQGYYFSKPLPADEFEQLIRKELS